MENYYFDADGLFSGSASAQPGTIAPENAVRVPPPEKPGFWPVIRPERDGWDLLEDHRGRKGWLNGRAASIAKPGPLPAGWSDSPPDAGDDLPERFYLTRGGTFHRAGCSHTKAVGRWLAPDEIRAAKPSAKPCARCRPGGAGGAGA